MADPFAYKRDKQLQARLAAEVAALVKQPTNAACADCGATRTVRFCSVTLGTFLCNRCYGLHRAIGAHVTRCKCIGLDMWAPDEVAKLRATGNAMARRTYEANVPPGTERPNAASGDREVERWIRDKYERRKYYGEPAASATPLATAAAPPPPPQQAAFAAMAPPQPAAAAAAPLFDLMDLALPAAPSPPPAATGPAAGWDAFGQGQAQPSMPNQAACAPPAATMPAATWDPFGQGQQGPPVPPAANWDPFGVQQPWSPFGTPAVVQQQPQPPPLPPLQPVPAAQPIAQPSLGNKLDNNDIMRLFQT